MTPCLKQQSCDLPFDGQQDSLHLGLLAKSREFSNSLDDAVEGLLSLSNGECCKKRPFASISTDQENSLHNANKKQKIVRFDSSTIFHQGKKRNAQVLNHTIPTGNQVCPQPLHNLFTTMAKQCTTNFFKFCLSKGFLRKALLPNGQPIFVVVAPFLPNCLSSSVQQPSQMLSPQILLPKSPPISENVPISKSIPFSSTVEVHRCIPANVPNNEVINCLSESQSEDSVDPEHSSSSSLSTHLKEPTSYSQESDISPKVSNPSIYLCREFASLRLNATSTFNQPPVAVDERYSLGMRPMMTEKEIMKIARVFFGDVQADKWEEELHLSTAHSLEARNACLTHYGHNVKNPRVKLIFQLLQCSDFFYSPRGQREILDKSLPCFVQDFESSLLRVLVPRREEEFHSCESTMDVVDKETMGSLSAVHNHDVGNLSAFSNKKNHKQNKFKEGSARFRNQQALFSNLPLVYFCVSHLIENHGMQLEYNLCQFLLLASCLEGRGVYHYRASNNLSIAHKAYRYMIERIGGKDFSTKKLESCDRAEKELIRTFEFAKSDLYI